MPEYTIRVRTVEYADYTIDAPNPQAALEELHEEANGSWNNEEIDVRETIRVTNVLSGEEWDLKFHDEEELRKVT